MQHTYYIKQDQGCCQVEPKSKLIDMRIFYHLIGHTVANYLGSYQWFLSSVLCWIVSSTMWKVSKYVDFSDPYFPVYGAEKTPYMGTFETVKGFRVVSEYWHCNFVFI